MITSPVGSALWGQTTVCKREKRNTLTIYMCSFILLGHFLLVYVVESKAN